MNESLQKWEKVVAAYKDGNERPFDQLLIKEYHKEHKPRLLSLTRSADDAWLIYVEAMLKFRDKFVLSDLPLPNNPDGYINRMERNIWIDICRKRNKKRQIHYVDIEVKQLGAMLTTAVAEYDPLFEKVSNEETYLAALEIAIGKMCDKCREIIEKNIFQNIKLKTLKVEMNYTGSYQAIVEKKKRCIKKLTKIFFMELNQQKK